MRGLVTPSGFYIRFALALPKPFCAASRRWSFCLAAVKASFHCCQTKSPPGYRREGLVTPSGFKPETS
jgi:hypothetical protein